MTKRTVKAIIKTKKIMTQFEKDLIDLLIKHNLVSEHALRVFRIQNRYKELIEQGIRSKQARHQVADEFFVSEKTVQYVIYRKTKEIM